MSHVSFSRADLISRSLQDCPQCRRPEILVGWYQRWYGWLWTCSGCGEKFSDEEWLPRPFRPGWRRDRIARARRRFITCREAGVPIDGDCVTGFSSPDADLRAAVLGESA